MDVCGICGDEGNGFFYVATDSREYLDARVCMLYEILCTRQGFHVCECCKNLLCGCAKMVRDVCHSRRIYNVIHKRGCFLCGVEYNTKVFKTLNKELEEKVLKRFKRQHQFKTVYTDTICRGCKETFLELVKLHTALHENIENCEVGKGKLLKKLAASAKKVQPADFSQAGDFKVERTISQALLDSAFNQSKHIEVQTMEPNAEKKRKGAISQAEAGPSTSAAALMTKSSRDDKLNAPPKLKKASRNSKEFEDVFPMSTPNIKIKTLTRSLSSLKGTQTKNLFRDMKQRPKKVSFKEPLVSTSLAFTPRMKATVLPKSILKETRPASDFRRREGIRLPIDISKIPVYKAPNLWRIIHKSNRSPRFYSMVDVPSASSRYRREYPRRLERPPVLLEVDEEESDVEPPQETKLAPGAGDKDDGIDAIMKGIVDSALQQCNLAGEIGVNVEAEKERENFDSPEGQQQE